MHIRIAGSKDISAIHLLAHKIWPVSYHGILPEEQIALMLDKMYSHESLRSQMDEGIIFLIVELEDRPIAFASYSLSDHKQSIYKIHKLYLLPEEQGKGIGALLTNFIKDDVLARGAKVLELNVNRNNPAFYFYKKYGFEVHEEADISYYQYVLNDYVMRLVL